MDLFSKIKKQVVDELNEKLASHLTYHCTDHTLYVLDRVVYIGKKEKVSNRNLLLLKIAALYHDIGFIVGAKEHEKRSCKILRKELKSSSFSETDIDKMCGMIMATRIPQTPNNHLEQILADADLEYLGTKHFDEISELLYLEIKHGNSSFTRKQWNELQISFIGKHQYHTKYCRQYKEKYKQKHLQQLINAS